MAREARERSSAPYIDGAVQCQLAPHENDEHYGFLADLSAYGTALWLHWTGSTKATLAALSDCPVSAPAPDGDGCCLFGGHGGRHTWESEQKETSSAG
uniref:hypothetical protein n=1 Tax=Streptomyces corallincola TaxID=2851888 RepID=UPI0027E35E18|nr:hypothetical protein [Streptomyces corallincola]